METVGVYRIFERSEANRSLRYTSYYGHGDSKAFNNVKDIFGYDSVVKYECIGHVQKRVGSRLRKLKKSTKRLRRKSIIPKETFVELLTLQFGAFLAVLQFNDGSKGILSVLEYLHIPMGYFILKGFSKVDDERIVDSERHSLPTTKKQEKRKKKLRGLKKGTVHYLRKRKVSRAVVPKKDGATCHTAHATINLLKDTFCDRLISRFGPVNWPPRSCDLKPLDYFLWDYAKPLVYADKPQTLDHLEDNICSVIADIRPQMLEKVI
ncbi:uncharacterized protein TNCV_2052721 [Trichonephila clavipes]|nr:uncharacterized protein TNCV_2052721 [Trichonephila clavipes]